MTPEEKERLQRYEDAANVTIDCRSEEGVTIGLIDAMISIARIAAKRDRSHPAIQAALKDMRLDEDVRSLVDFRFAASIVGR